MSSALIGKPIQSNPIGNNGFATVINAKGVNMKIKVTVNDSGEISWAEVQSDASVCSECNKEVWAVYYNGEIARCAVCHDREAVMSMLHPTNPVRRTK
jgi:hypothetical protein